MALRKIRLSTDEILRKKSKAVKEITPAILTLIDDMKDTMHSLNGQGIAAVQLGVLKRICLVERIEEKDKDKEKNKEKEKEKILFEIINPEIIETRDEQEGREGCLSVPGHSGMVKRPNYIKFKALDRNGEEFVMEAEGALAVPFFHEFDHLEGILYTDRLLSPLEEDDEEEE